MSSSVPTRTLDSILEEAEAPVPIDLLSIDVEGHEIEVLRGFDFSRWQPLLILVEDHVGNLRTHRYLKQHGYRLIRRLGHNGWYVPAGDARDIRAAERWEILRKYYLALPFRVVAQCLAPGPAALRRLVGAATLEHAATERHHHHPERGRQHRGLSRQRWRSATSASSSMAAAPTKRRRSRRARARGWCRIPSKGFGAQKGFALSLATGDWVLSIDADERVTPELAQEIGSAVASRRRRMATRCRGVRRFCGRVMDHSGWSPDYVLRLFRRDKAYFSERPRA